MSTYYYQTADSVEGTTDDISKLKHLISINKLHANSYIYYEGLDTWTSIKDTALNNQLFPPPPPPLPSSNFSNIVTNAARRSSRRRSSTESITSTTSNTSRTSNTSNTHKSTVLEYDFGGARNNKNSRRKSLVDVNHPHMNQLQLDALDLDASRTRYNEENGRTYSKPKQIYCFLCAREFGTRSLKIHWKSCIRRYHASSVGKKQMKTCPAPPDERFFPFPRNKHASNATFHEYNVEALRIFGVVSGNTSLWEKLKRKNQAEEEERDRLAALAAEQERLRLEAEERLRQENEALEVARALAAEQERLRLEAEEKVRRENEALDAERRRLAALEEERVRLEEAALLALKQRFEAAWERLRSIFNDLEALSNGEEWWSQKAWQFLNEADAAGKRLEDQNGYFDYSIGLRKSAQYVSLFEEAVDAAYYAVEAAALAAEQEQLRLEKEEEERVRQENEALEAERRRLAALAEDRRLQQQWEEEERARRLAEEQERLLRQRELSEAAERKRRLQLAQERKGRFLKRGDGRRAADQAKVGYDLQQQNVANKTRLRKRNSIVQGNRRQQILKEQGVDLHYHEWDPNSEVDTTWRKGHVGGQMIRVKTQQAPPAAPSTATSTPFSASKQLRR